MSMPSLIRRPGPIVAAVLFVAAACATGAGADDAVPSTNPDGENSTFFDDARGYVITSEAGAVTLSLREKSLLNWTNPQRLQERGGIYVWLDRGRPLVIGSFFTYVHQEKVFKKHEFHSLADGPLSAAYAGQAAWTPLEAGVNWQDFKDAPRPGSSHVNRLLQMRQLARRFRAELTSPEGDRNELRFAPRPLLEYASPSAGIIDGAILTYVVATDPEVLLLIEAVESPGEAPRYRYAFARFHYWDVAVYEGDKRLWSAPLDKAHELNSLGDAENMSKVYNSFHIRGVGVPEPSSEQIQAQVREVKP